MESAAIFVNAHKAEHFLLLPSTTVNWKCLCTNQYIDGAYLLCQFTYHHFLCRYCDLMHQWCKTARCAKWLIKLQKNVKKRETERKGERELWMNWRLISVPTQTGKWASEINSHWPLDDAADCQVIFQGKWQVKNNNTKHQDCALFSALRIVWQFMWTTGLTKEHQKTPLRRICLQINNSLNIIFRNHIWYVSVNKLRC